MKKLLFPLMALTFIGSAQAVSTKRFLDEYLQTIDDIILERKSEGNNKYCDKIKRADIYDDFSYLDETGTRVIYYNIKGLGIDVFKSMISERIECYDKVLDGQNGSLVGGIFNSRAYSKDRGLIRDSLERLAGKKVKDYKKISDYFDLD